MTSTQITNFTNKRLSESSSAEWVDNFNKHMHSNPCFYVYQYNNWNNISDNKWLMAEIVDELWSTFPKKQLVPSCNSNNGCLRGKLGEQLLVNYKLYSKQTNKAKTNIHPRWTENNLVASLHVIITKQSGNQHYKHFHTFTSCDVKQYFTNWDKRT